MTEPEPLGVWENVSLDASSLATDSSSYILRSRASLHQKSTCRIKMDLVDDGGCAEMS